MLKNFYYADVFVDGQEKTPHYIPQFILSNRNAPLNYPFIYGCDFRYDGLHLHRLTEPNDRFSIPYSQIKWIDLYVVRRRWGTTIMTMMIPCFDFDLIVHTEHEEYEIEFPAFFGFHDVMERLRLENIYVMDVLDVFKQFPDPETFKSDFGTYFEKNYHAIAREHGLDDPRVGFKKTAW